MRIQRQRRFVRASTPASCPQPVAEGMAGRNHYDPSGTGTLAQGDTRARSIAADLGNPELIPEDTSNPYFTYDPSKCIVCSRCVRACEEVQGTFALTIEGHGFESRVSAGMSGDALMASDCVSCGACVQACPTATPLEKSIIKLMRASLQRAGTAPSATASV